MRKIITTRIIILIILSIICSSKAAFSQVTITSSRASIYSISPSDLVQIMVLNNGVETNYYIEAQIINSAKEKILTVVTTPFLLKKGLNTIQSNQFSFSSLSYSSSAQGNFLKVNKRLPAGNFTYCVRIVPTTQFEDGDEYCQEFDANDNGMMYLVYPSDEEVIETKTPLLIWMHNEQFNLLAPGESYRLMVVELDDNQSAQSGIEMKSPIFIKNNLSQHQVQYAFDAKKLEEGKNYGWKVQKIANGSVVNETEAWKFGINKEDLPKDMMFVALKRELDGSYYNVVNDRVFFKFDEKYNQKKINCIILNNKNEEIKPDIGKVNHSDELVEIENMSNEVIKSTGYNQFELDLIPYKLKTGFYILKVVNNKNEEYKLKFYVK